MSYLGMSEWEAPLDKGGTVFAEGWDRSQWKAGTGPSGRLGPVPVEGWGLSTPKVNSEQNLVIIIGATSPARPAPHSTGPNTRDLLLWTEDSGKLHPDSLSVERSEEEPTGHQDPQICLMSH